MRVGYHNPDWKFGPLENHRPIENPCEKNTKPSIMLKLDGGNCLKAGADPVGGFARIPAESARFHLKDLSPNREGSPFYSVKALHLGKKSSKPPKRWRVE